MTVAWHGSCSLPSSLLHRKDRFRGEDNYCGSYINDDYIWMDQGHITDYAAEKYTYKKFKKILEDIYGKNNY